MKVAGTAPHQPGDKTDILDLFCNGVLSAKNTCYGLYAACDLLSGEPGATLGSVGGRSSLLKA